MVAHVAPWPQYPLFHFLSPSPFTYPMARVTTSDCSQYIENHFDLTLFAAKRAVQLNDGSQAKIKSLGDKATVLALREIAIAESTVDSINEEETFLLEQSKAMPRLNIKSLRQKS